MPIRQETISLLKKREPHRFGHAGRKELTMRKQCCLSAALLVLLAAGCKQPSWEQFTNQEGKFTVLMPGKPKYETRDKDQLKVHNFVVEGRDYAYLVSYTDLPRGGVDNLEAVYAEGVKGVAATQGGKILSQSDFTIDGHTGKSYEIEVTKPKAGFAAGRMVVIDGRLYQLLVMGSKIRATDADVNKFFDSFKVNK
jgi:hypothetical protein